MQRCTQPGCQSSSVERQPSRYNAGLLRTGLRSQVVVSQRQPEVVKGVLQVERAVYDGRLPLQQLCVLRGREQGRCIWDQGSPTAKLADWAAKRVRRAVPQRTVLTRHHQAVPVIVHSQCAQPNATRSVVAPFPPPQAAPWRPRPSGRTAPRARPSVRHPPGSVVHVHRRAALPWWLNVYRYALPPTDWSGLAHIGACPAGRAAQCMHAAEDFSTWWREEAHRRLVHYGMYQSQLAPSVASPPAPTWWKPFSSPPWNSARHHRPASALHSSTCDSKEAGHQRAKRQAQSPAQRPYGRQQGHACQPALCTSIGSIRRRCCGTRVRYCSAATLPTGTGTPITQLLIWKRLYLGPT